jgi:hypothetical protein
MRMTGGWQAAGPGAGQRNTGSWQAAGSGRGPAAGPRGDGRGDRNTGSWRAAGPQSASGWAPGQEQSGQGQSGQGFRNTGSWQAAGAASGQQQPGPGPQPYPGQQYPGQPYPGQPYPGQQYPGQQYPGGQYPGQPHPGGAAGPRNTGGFSRVGSPLIKQRDSALPDPPPSPKGPVAAIENDNIAAFARDLRVLRSKAALDYPDMAEKSHYTMRTLASAAGGLRLPTLPVVIAYVNACDGDVAEWEERWGRLTKSGRKGPAELPSGDQPPGPQSAQSAQSAQERIPRGARQTGEIYVITSAKQRDAQW